MADSLVLRLKLELNNPVCNDTNYDIVSDPGAREAENEIDNKASGRICTVHCAFPVSMERVRGFLAYLLLFMMGKNSKASMRK